MIQIMRMVPKQGFSFESIISQITSAHNIKSILELYKNNKEIYKVEHYVLSYRILGRYSNVISKEDTQNPTYQELTTKLNDLVTQLSEYDLVDILFWLRKSKQDARRNNITYQTEQQIRQSIDDLCEKKQLSMRSLVNIFYDSAFAGVQSNRLPKTIIDCIRENPKQVGPFAIFQLLATLKRKLDDKPYLTQDEDELLRVILGYSQQIDELEFDSKLKLFKIFSSMNLENTRSKALARQTLDSLKNSIFQRISYLNDDQAVQILYAYSSIYAKQLNKDLLIGVADFLIAKLEQDQYSIPIEYLVKGIQILSNYANKSFKQRVVKKFIESLIAQLNISNQETINHQIYHVVQYYAKTQIIPEETFVNFLKEQLAKQFDIKLAVALFRLNQNVAAQVKANYQTIDQSKIKILAYFLSYKHDPEFAQQIFEEIKNEDSFTILRQFVLNLPEVNYLKSIPYVQNALSQEIEKLKSDRIKGDKIQLQNILGVVYNVENVKLILDAIKDNQALQNRILRQFKDSINTNINSISIYLLKQILELKQYNFKTDYLAYAFFGDELIIQQLIKKNLLFQTLKIFEQSFATKKDKSSLLSITIIIQHLRTVNNTFFYIRDFLRSVAQVIQFNNLSDLLGDSIFSYLIQYNVINPKTAQQIVASTCREVYKRQVAHLLFGLQELSKELQDYYLSKKQEYFKQLESSDPKQQALAFKELCLFSLTQEEESQLLAVSENIKIGNSFLKQIFIQSNNQKILKQLVNVYEESCIHKQNIEDLVLIIQNLVKNKVIRISLINRMIDLFAEQFYQIASNVRIIAIQILADIKAIQIDFILSNVEVLKQRRSYQNIDLLLSAISLLGIQSQDLNAHIQQIIQYCSFKFKYQNLNGVLRYFALNNEPIEKIDAIMERIKVKGHCNFGLEYFYFIAKYPDSITAKKLKEFATPEQTVIFRYKQPLHVISNYLESIGVEHEKFYFKDGLPIDIYIPSTNQAIDIQANYFLSKDGEATTGLSLLKKQIYELAKVETIEIKSKEFFEGEKSDQEKISFLISKGIKPISEPDFTKLKNTSNKKKTEEVEEVEPITAIEPEPEEVVEPVPEK
ncbi:hypothetical protein pb186bvf_004264 [Paramecium bursaria]